MYRKIAPYYKYIFPSSPVQRKFFRRLFEEHGVKSVLDVACGSGEQLEMFADMGVKADGLELEEAMVQLINNKLCGHPAGIRVKAGNMLDAADIFQGPYDAAINIGNSLVHLSNLDEISGAIRSMARVMAPGGLAIIQIVNYDRILDNRVTSLSTIETKDGDGNPLTFQRDYDLSGLPETIRFITRLKVGDLDLEGSTPLFPLRSEALSTLANEAGFVRPVLYGGYDFSPFSPESQGCILVAEKES